MAYRMPAEWEPHAATLIAWPFRTSDWPGKFAPIPWVYADIVRALAASEPVIILIQNAAHEAAARRVLQRMHVPVDAVTFLEHAADRSWVRDSGPIGVHDQGAIVALDWHFNGWAKYPDWQNDDAVPKIVAAHLQQTRIQPMHQGRRVVLEGGSIDVNGAGMLLTTEECLLSPVQERNPGFTARDYEQVFAEHLGIDRVIWLGRGIAGDDTHGHVDDLARFVRADAVVTVVESNPKDDNYLPLQENLERLNGIAGLTVVPLPMPRPIRHRKQRLPASYANFYINNRTVLVPTFNDVQDRNALGILAELFPGREIVGIHCSDLVWGLGTLHCMTQQIPARISAAG